MSSVFNRTAQSSEIGFSYDLLGDITSKSDVGTYTFPVAGQAHPHGVTSIANVAGLGGGTTNVSYDGDGQLTAETGTIARTVSWTLFNKPASATYGGLTLNYQYDADGNRIMRTGPQTGTLIYLPDGQVFFHTGAARANWIWTSFYETDGQKVASSGGYTGAALNHQYYHADYQGSVTIATDGTFNPSTGQPILQNLGYDSYGQPRNANGSPDPNWGSSAITQRGYIDQEQITTLRLVDLNARLYDPQVGQLLSPDPIIHDQSDSQAWNSYAYSRDNPASDSDPTGLDAYSEPQTGSLISGNPDTAEGYSCSGCSNATLVEARGVSGKSYFSYILNDDGTVSNATPSQADSSGASFFSQLLPDGSSNFAASPSGGFEYEKPGTASEEPLTNGQSVADIGVNAGYINVRDLLAQTRQELQNTNVRAFLGAIANAEGGAYNKLYGGGTFKNMSTHPPAVPCGARQSRQCSAAGEYSIVIRSWKWYGRPLGLTDFYPGTQDLIATRMLDFLGAISPIENGNIGEAVQLTNTTWSSLPGGSQQRVDMATFQALYVSHLPGM